MNFLFVMLRMSSKGLFNGRALLYHKTLSFFTTPTYSKVFVISDTESGNSK